MLIKFASFWGMSIRLRKRCIVRTKTVYSNFLSHKIMFLVLKRAFYNKIANHIEGIQFKYLILFNNSRKIDLFSIKDARSAGEKRFPLNFHTTIYFVHET